MDDIRPQLEGKPRTHALWRQYDKLEAEYKEWDKIGDDSINWLARKTAHNNKRYGDRVINQSKIKQ